MFAGSSLWYENHASMARSRPIRPARDDVPHRDPRRVLAVHERLHQGHARLAGHVDHPLRLVRRSAPAASRTGPACRPGAPRWSTRRGGGWAAGCTRRRRPGPRGATRSVSWARGMPSSPATRSARSAFTRRDRDDLAAGRAAHPRDDLAQPDVGRREDAPAQPPAVVRARARRRSRHRHLLVAGPRVLVAACGSDLTGVTCLARVWHTFARKEHKPCDSVESTSDSAARPCVGRTCPRSSAGSTTAARCRAPSSWPRPA